MTDIAASNSRADWFAEARKRGELARRERVARIHRVDTKCLREESFGNDGNGSADVDTKCGSCSTFGNDASIGFIRVRRRQLKSKLRGERPPTWRGRSTSSASFDLVRAVRIDGKPRHEFLLGLGSQKEYERDYDLVWFWVRAVRKMVRHEIAEHQRNRLIAEMVRKGARPPTIPACEEHLRCWGSPEVNEIVRWLRR